MKGGNMIPMKFIALWALGLTAVAAPAQVLSSGGQTVMAVSGNTGGLLGLLGRKDVQDDLELTADQMVRVSELQSEIAPLIGRTAVSGGGGNAGVVVRSAPNSEEWVVWEEEERRAVTSVLSKAQAKRLGEIKIQIEGNRAVMDREVQSSLAVTDDQLERIQAAIQVVHESVGTVIVSSNDGPPDPQQIAAHLNEMESRVNDAVGAVLSQNQKAALKKMGGAPFKRNDPPIVIRHATSFGQG